MYTIMCSQGKNFPNRSSSRIQISRSHIFEKYYVWHQQKISWLLTGNVFSLFAMVLTSVFISMSPIFINLRHCGHCRGGVYEHFRTYRIVITGGQSLSAIAVCTSWVSLLCHILFSSGDDSSGNQFGISHLSQISFFIIHICLHFSNFNRLICGT